MRATLTLPRPLPALNRSGRAAQEPGFVIATTDDSSPPPVTEGQTFHHIKNFAGPPSLLMAVAVSKNVSRQNKGKRISGWAENAARRGRHGAGDEHRRGGGAGRWSGLCQRRGGRCVRLPNPDRMRRPNLIERSVLPRSDLAEPSVF